MAAKIMTTTPEELLARTEIERENGTLHALGEHNLFAIYDALSSVIEERVRLREQTQWQPIDTAPKDGRARLVSWDGRVTCDGIERKQHLSDKGYARVQLGKRSVAVHRLVAAAFCANPSSHPEVNHIDGNKANNKANNLEWCTRSHNMRHAYEIGLHTGVVLSGKESPNWKRNGKRHPQSMAVRATFPDGSTKDYESQGLAEQDGFRAPRISDCINGRRKSHGGAIWMSLPNPSEEQK